jgi:hypothetical protein
MELVVVVMLRLNNPIKDHLVVGVVEETADKAARYESFGLALLDNSQLRRWVFYRTKY